MTNVQIWLNKSQELKDHIQQWCQPIENYFSTTRFYYYHIHANGKGSLISSYPQELAFYLDNQFYCYDPHLVCPQNIKEGTALWSGYDHYLFQGKMLFHMETAFQTYYPVTFIRKDNHGGFKAFCFATQHYNQQILSAYYNQYATFDVFIDYIDKKMSDILQNSCEIDVNLALLKGKDYNSQLGITH